MRQEASQDEVAQLKEVIQNFIFERKASEIETLGSDQRSARDLIAHDWLAHAAHRATKLKAATHTLKQVHPDARGSCQYVTTFPDHPGSIVGSHVLAKPQVIIDIVGNAAYFDVCAFLLLEHDGVTLLERLSAGDPAILKAMSDEPSEANEWANQFTEIFTPDLNPVSSSLAKQLFFPLAGGEYHLLEPLFPSSLAGFLREIIREDRFGESANSARDSMKNGLFADVGFSEYPNMVTQKFGGSKPQNISYQNTRRKGENWLLPSLPPTWHTNDLKPPTTVATVLDKWLFQRRSIRELTRSLREFLKKSGDYTNINIRQHRADLVARIVDEVFLFSFELLELPAGWSAEAGCRLDRSEALWLDPNRRFSDDDFKKEYEWKDWPDEIARRFGNWLNAVISTDRTPMGEAEAQQWQRDLEQEISLFRLEV